MVDAGAVCEISFFVADSSVAGATERGGVLGVVGGFSLCELRLRSVVGLGGSSGSLSSTSPSLTSTDWRFCASAGLGAAGATGAGLGGAFAAVGAGGGGPLNGGGAALASSGAGDMPGGGPGRAGGSFECIGGLLTALFKVTNGAIPFLRIPSSASSSDHPSSSESFAVLSVTFVAEGKSSCLVKLVPPGGGGVGVPEEIDSRGDAEEGGGGILSGESPLF